jgi:hypothetical protein
MELRLAAGRKAPVLRAASTNQEEERCRGGVMPPCAALLPRKSSYAFTAAALLQFAK